MLSVVIALDRPLTSFETVLVNFLFVALNFADFVVSRCVVADPIKRRFVIALFLFLYADKINKVITTMVIRLLSTTTHNIVLDLRSPVWGFGESWTIVHGITSQPADVFSDAFYSHFRRYLTTLMKSERGLFDPHPGFVGRRERGGRVVRPFDGSPMGSYKFLGGRYDLSPTVF